MFLRTVAYFGILFFFLNLEKLTEQTLTKNSRALVLIDTSQSMGLRDGQSPENPTNASRLNLVADELAQGTLIKDLRENHDVVVYRFDEESKPTEISTFPKLPSEGLAANEDGSLSQDTVAIAQGWTPHLFGWRDCCWQLLYWQASCT